MLRINSKSLFRAGLVVLIFCSWASGPSSAQVCSAITVTPDSVVAGGSPETLTFNANGMFDLTAVLTSEIGIVPSSDIGPISIASQTAQTLTFKVSIANSATPGVRTLFITDQTGTKNLVALNLTITSPPPPPVCNPTCAATQTCSSVGSSDFCLPPICKPACTAREICQIDGKCRALPPPPPPCRGTQCQ
jgi:hypothetical protein